MADKQQVDILWHGAKEWNDWRKKHPRIRPELSKAFLDLAEIGEADLKDANLRGASIIGAEFSDANFSRANLKSADLRSANLKGANLFGACLCGANLSGTNLRETNLRKANLIDANLIGAELSDAILSGANFRNAYLGATIFGNNDLRAVKCLRETRHYCPSTIGIDTLYRSGYRIAESFLRGVGVPDTFIRQVPSLVSAEQAIQYYSCFISYSTKDEEFAKLLYLRLKDEHVPVWFAPEDMKGGHKLHEQIDEAIRVTDKLLVVLSDHSIMSNWVKTEIRRACKQEVREKRRKLFPIALVDFETLKGWEFFDADLGKDLAAEVRSYYIPGFQNWKNHDEFEKAFQKLIKALKAK